MLYNPVLLLEIYCPARLAQCVAVAYEVNLTHYYLFRNLSNSTDIELYEMKTA